MDIRNPVFTADGRIDCEIEHPVCGWIPFTADPNDVEQHGRDIHAAALAMGPSAYVAPALLPQAARAAVLAAIARVEDALTSGVPLAEKLSWPSKEAAARAVQAGTGSALDVALLAGESALTGETVEELAARIIAAADAYRFAVSRMAGIRRGAEARIAAATTPAQLEQAVAWAEAACAAIIEAAGGV